MCARPVTPWSMGFHDYWNGEAGRSADDSSHKRARRSVRTTGEVPGPLRGPRDQELWARGSTLLSGPLGRREAEDRHSRSFQSLGTGRLLVVWCPVLGELGQGAGCPEWWPAGQALQTGAPNGCLCMYGHSCMLSHFSHV